MPNRLTVLENQNNAHIIIELHSVQKWLVHLYLVRFSWYDYFDQKLKCQRKRPERRFVTVETKRPTSYVRLRCKKPRSIFSPTKRNALHRLCKVHVAARVALCAISPKMMCWRNRVQHLDRNPAPQPTRPDPTRPMKVDSILSRPAGQVMTRKGPGKQRQYGGAYCLHTVLLFISI